MLRLQPNGEISGCGISQTLNATSDDGKNRKQYKHNLETIQIISSARAEGGRPDVLGDDLVGAIAEVEVNEIGEAGHRSQAKSRTRESLVGKEEDAMRCVAQGMSPKLRDARGIYTAKLAAVGGWRESGSRAGRFI